MSHKHSTRGAGVLALLLVPFAAPAGADLTPEWFASIDAGTALGAGTAGMVVDGAGVSYITGTAGPSSNTDVKTAAFASDGTLLWSHTFNGPVDWHDQARGIALGDGVVHVCGNTPGPTFHARVLVLKYDAATGALLDTIEYSSGPGLSEHGQAVAVDAFGDIYVAGGTVGDGGDAMVLKFDANGDFVWKRVWDGPAFAPYSQDHADEVVIAPDGHPVVRIHGVMASNHPDFVAVKYDAADGSTIWEATWGVNGGDFAADLEIDAAGDIYMTGTGIDFTDRYSTVKFRGSDGQLLWQRYDSAGIDDHAVALTLDGQGGVYVTGAVDFDGDTSNFNDVFYTVKRDATTGAQLWTHMYGATCVGCFDVPSDVLVDSSGHVWLAGRTSSPPYNSDTITFVLDAGTGLELDRGVVSGGPAESANSGVLRFDSGENLYNGGGLYDANTGEKAFSVLKYAAFDASWENYCVTAPNSSGSGAIIGASGSASVPQNDFTLTVTGASSSQLGLFYYGPSQIQQPFGDGFRCVGGTTFRLGPPVQTTPGGSVQRQLDFTQPPASSGPGAITAGSHWNFQFWYRDPAFGGATFNLSDGLSVDF